MEYTKDFREREDLVDQLAHRGLTIPDKARAVRFLTRVGYFRSGAYRYVLRRPLPADLVNADLRQYRSDDYVDGATFAHLEYLESFDSKLAKVCLEGLLDFEIRVRAAIAHTLASRNVAAHASSRFLDAAKCEQAAGEGTKFDAWERTYRAAVKAAAEKEDFVAHHLKKYPQQAVPIWAVTEALSFGDLPYLFDLMTAEDARSVARQFGFEHPRKFGAVLRMMSDFRNVAAHGARLFNRAFKRALVLKSHETREEWLDHLVEDGFTSTPKERQRLYPYAAVLAFMLRSHVSGTNWHMTFKTQVKKFELGLMGADGHEVVSRERNMGFPGAWETLPLWTLQ